MSAELPGGWFWDGDIGVYRRIYAELVPIGGKTAEIGVYKGRSICSVANIITAKNLDVLVVDKWEPWLLDGSPHLYEQFVDTAVRFGIIKNLNIQQGASLDIAELTPERSLDFVFIDADHSYPAVKSDIEAWAKKVKPGGWIGGHDYGTENNWGVIEAVVERFGVNTRQPDSYIWLTQIKEVVEWDSAAAD